ncbi:MAG TPA: DNA methyltransferase, partial [Ferrovibrio sp.]|uniref:DNA methyltransferase n=1 Tax=Ferrovibrio sp. TaxID=1917215 RepID=UPI002ED59C75
MRGEHVVGEGKKAKGRKRATAIPGGRGTGKNSVYLFKTDAGYKPVYKDRDSIPAGLLYGEIQNFDGAGRQITGTSIFDPVLCELVYRWFCPPRGLVLDPFAGGSVRGIVAARLGRDYIGIDLRPEQIEANRVQADAICDDPIPVWIEGDARDIATLAKGVEADLIFSCPPYHDLEVYSDDPRDLSTMPYDSFRAVYAEIVAACAAMLKPDRFACFVVGDVRDSKGLYRGFPWHTIEAFEAAGLRLYNEAVLVTAVGSLPVRVGRQFE